MVRFTDKIRAKRALQVNCVFLNFIELMKDKKLDLYKDTK